MIESGHEGYDSFLHTLSMFFKYMCILGLFNGSCFIILCMYSNLGNYVISPNGKFSSGIKFKSRVGSRLIKTGNSVEIWQIGRAFVLADTPATCMYNHRSNYMYACIAQLCSACMVGWLCNAMHLS